MNFSEGARVVALGVVANIKGQANDPVICRWAVKQVVILREMEGYEKNGQDSG